MKKFMPPVALVLMVAFAGSVCAQNTNTPNLDKRDQKQETRIQQGEKSGELTDKEAAKLEAGQAKVDAREAAAKADGNVTKKERAELQHARDKQSAKIYKQKHDAQKKP
ncbi:MAG: hypothetical protein DIJKHBIC_02454 [Thermoanaerobaculia bacterium]|nr:hypothetical protein [Thermoanaerobaculia bacterium]